MSEKGVIEDFKKKSSTYYQDVYVEGKDLNRVNRLTEIDEILGRLKVENKLVLDAGSGPGVLFSTVKKHKGEYTALDISPDNIKAAKERECELEGYTGSVTEMPFDDSSFDVVLSTGCLEYVKDIERAIIEISRVLKQGGMFTATFANLKNPGRIWNETIVRLFISILNLLKNKTSYKRYLYSSRRVSEMLEVYGFKEVEVIYINFTMWGYPFSKIGILNNIDDFLIKKFTSLKKYSSEFIITAKKSDA